MAEYPIGANHLAHFTAVEHIGTFLQAEQARLTHELAFVRAREAEVVRNLKHLLLQSYGIDPAVPATIDSARGVIITPEPDHPVSSPSPDAPPGTE
ncbi:MAG: hypothetical protein KGH75_00675 [Rhodospirillales bacterium]|nr:hypothetical protein [Rhodospirillales bacterium]